ncbi:hypothetical protein J3Q64DRAFT_1696262 [Phycomyces blakesleeanus]|uniref:Uncharacterized protein n=2 Tax=Phycomyces blakesleeanus TaxID=4837 RepID=A0A162Q905_PHYB8|nr:hypothetical protein PHYBLDRAFT_72942 [Phycomyces blakesleeanus NRRL 1555(-)]OAD81116.1 hypothetical protein PHYBLDRAFT_72942 [Phycomyces blakesleeanus NRRL 1555(-)]|eukprot:XP_018299156.1 hypothetical protein PHYBLDRAFT_72942 [Phycomyces blakesleeanus NRRL 1555(-)]
MSKSCPNHKLTKAKEMKGLLGNTTTMTRKIKPAIILRKGTKEISVDKVLKVCKHFRNIVIRAQLFVNYYIIVNSDRPIDEYGLKIDRPVVIIIERLALLFNSYYSIIEVLSDHV